MCRVQITTDVAVTGLVESLQRPSSLWVEPLGTSHSWAGSASAERRQVAVGPRGGQGLDLRWNFVGSIYLASDSLVYLKGRPAQVEGETEILHLLVHSPDG